MSILCDFGNLSEILKSWGKTRLFPNRDSDILQTYEYFGATTIGSSAAEKKKTYLGRITRILDVAQKVRRSAKYLNCGNGVAERLTYRLTAETSKVYIDNFRPVFFSPQYKRTPSAACCR